MTPDSRAVLLYDADCGFCTRVAENLWRLQLAAVVEPMQSRDLPVLGVDPERALREMPFIDAGGRVSYGHRAWAQALRHSHPVLRPAGHLLDAPVVRSLAGRVYAWVSANRHRMPGGTAACSIPRDNPAG